MNDLQSTLRRYAQRIENNGTWTVFDAFTGRPAEVGSRQAVGMQMGDAQEMVDILNRVHPANDAGTVH